MVGGRGDFRLGGLEKLLVSAVHEFGDFATDQIAGIREYLYAIIAIFLNRRRAIVFLEENTALHTGRFDQIETVIPKPVQRVFVPPLLYLACHRALKPPLAGHSLDAHT